MKTDNKPKKTKVPHVAGYPEKDNKTYQKGNNE